MTSAWMMLMVISRGKIAIRTRHEFSTLPFHTSKVLE